MQLLLVVDTMDYILLHLQGVGGIYVTHTGKIEMRNNQVRCARARR